MDKFYGLETRKHWIFCYVYIFFQVFISFSLAFPTAVYLAGPLLVQLLHGIPYSFGLAKAISVWKLSKFIFFISLWVSAILWLQKFIPWYLKKRCENR